MVKLINEKMIAQIKDFEKILSFQLKISKTIAVNGI